MVPESNFRKIVKLHHEKLLHFQHLYWKKRCTQRFIKVGEENSNFFHAMATERHRRNSIVSLTLPDGTTCSDHGGLAQVFHDSFRDRMGVAKGISMGFDLSTLLSSVEGLDVLTKPFDKEEMDDIVKHMPTDKAPGPDGFNGMFLKKC